jgi:hypothetical protein
MRQMSNDNTSKPVSIVELGKAYQEKMNQYVFQAELMLEPKRPIVHIKDHIIASCINKIIQNPNYLLTRNRLFNPGRSIVIFEDFGDYKPAQ